MQHLSAVRYAVIFLLIGTSPIAHATQHDRKKGHYAKLNKSDDWELENLSANAASDTSSTTSSPSNRTSPDTHQEQQKIDDNGKKTVNPSTDKTNKSPSTPDSKLPCAKIALDIKQGKQQLARRRGSSVKNEEELDQMLSILKNIVS